MCGCFVMNCKLGFYLYMVVVSQAKGLFARRDQSGTWQDWDQYIRRFSDRKIDSRCSEKAGQ